MGAIAKPRTIIIVAELPKPRTANILRGWHREVASTGVVADDTTPVELAETYGRAGPIKPPTGHDPFDYTVVGTAHPLWVGGSNPNTVSPD